MDPSYNSPLLRRASAARAPSTGSFYDVTDHIATLTTNDLLCRLTHTGHGTALKFLRSAGTNVPLARGRVGALHTFLDGRTQEDRAHAAVSLDLSGSQRHGRTRYIGFSRIMLARGLFSREPAPPLRPTSRLCGRPPPKKLGVAPHTPSFPEV